MAAYEITTTNTRLVFDTQRGRDNSCVLIDTNHFINFWKDIDGYGKVQVMTINTSTWAVTTNSSPLQYTTYADTRYASAAKIDDNHFINIFKGADADGFAQVFTVNTSTWAVTTANSALEFETNLISDNACVQIDSNHFIIAWAGNSVALYTQVLTINTSTWAITTANSALSGLGAGAGINLCQIDENHFIGCFCDNAYASFAQIYEVNTSTWAITTKNDRTNFFGAIGSTYNIEKIDDTHYLVTWSYGANGGRSVVLIVNTSTWAITTGATAFNYVGGYGSESSLEKVDANHFIAFVGGQDGDGFAVPLVVNTSTWAVSTSVAALEFDTVDNGYNSSFAIDSNHFLNVYAGASAYGYAEVFYSEPGSTDWTKSLSETIDLGDTIIKEPGKKTIDSTTASDSVIKGIEKSQADNTAISDDVESASVLNRSQSETINLADIIKKISGKNQTDSINLSDALLKTSGKKLAETIALADLISKSGDISLTEALAVADSGLVLTINKNISDNFEINDNVALLSVYNRLISENLPLSDAIAIVSEFSHSLSETVALSDDIATTMILYQELADTLGLQDNLIFSFEKYVQDNLTLSDLLSSIQEHYKTLAEQMNLSDEIKSSINKKIDDSIALVDNLETAMALSRDLSDIIGLQDELKFNIGKYVADNLTITDAIETLKTYFRNLSEQINLSDQTTAVINKGLSDEVSITDNLVISIEKILIEMMTINDLLVIAIGKAIADGLNTSELLEFVRGKGKNLQDSLVVSEVLMTNVNKNINDSTTIADIISTAVDYKLSIQDSVTVIETLIKQYDLGLSEAVAVVDSLTKNISRPLGRKVVVNSKKDRIILISNLS